MVGQAVQSRAEPRLRPVPHRDFERERRKHRGGGDRQGQERGHQGACGEHGTELENRHDVAREQRGIADRTRQCAPDDRSRNGAERRARGFATVSFFPQIIAKVDRQVACGGHGEDDDLRHEGTTGERELQSERCEHGFRGEPDRPSGDDRHDGPPQALRGRERDEADQKHPCGGQATAIALDRREAIGEQNGRADQSGGGDLVSSGPVVGDSTKRGDGRDRILIRHRLEPDDQGGALARLAHDGPLEQRVRHDLGLEVGQDFRVGRPLHRAGDRERRALLPRQRDQCLHRPKLDRPCERRPLDHRDDPVVDLPERRHGVERLDLDDGRNVLRVEVLGQLREPRQPFVGEQLGVVVGDEYDIVVTERLRRHLVLDHRRVGYREERLERLLIRDVFAEHDEVAEQAEYGGEHDETGRNEDATHDRRLAGAWSGRPATHRL